MLAPKDPLRSLPPRALLAIALAAGVPAPGAGTATPPATPGDFVIHDFAFDSGERVGELRLHYVTLGAPHRGTAGRVDNAVLVLHGTGGSGRQFLRPDFAGV